MIEKYVYEDNNFYNYLNHMKQKENCIIPRFRFYLLDHNENPIEVLDSVDIVLGSGSLHKDNKNGSRRTLSFSLINTDNKYNYLRVNSFFKWRQKYQFFLGIQYNNIVYWIPQGIFVLKTLSESSKQISISLSDKFCLLDGSIDGLLSEKYKMIAGEVTIKDILEQLIINTAGVHKNSDPKSLIIQDNLLDELIPYTISKEATNKVSDILSELGTIFNAEYFYDENGHFVFKNKDDNNKTLKEKGVGWSFNINDFYLTSYTVGSYDYSKFYNKVKVTGNSNGELGLIEGEYLDTNPYSPVHYSEDNPIRQCCVTDTKIRSSVLAEQRAKTELLSILTQEFSNKLQCVYLPHLEAGMLVEVQQEEDLQYLSYEKYLITSIDIPLQASSVMSISLTKIQDILLEDWF